MGCDHKFVDSTRCLKCGWAAPKRAPVVVPATLAPPEPVEVCSCEEALALREERDHLRERVRAQQIDADRLRRQITTPAAACQVATLRAELAACEKELEIVKGSRDGAAAEVERLTLRVAELEDLGYAGALKLATAYADLNAVEGRLREAVGLLREWHHRHAASNALSRKTASILVATYELQPAAPDPIHPHGRVIEQAQCTDEFEPAEPKP